MGAIVSYTPREGQILSSVFIVQKYDGSTRLILNLKFLNRFMLTNDFKLDDRSMASKLMSKNCFLASITFSVYKVDETGGFSTKR